MSKFQSITDVWSFLDHIPSFQSQGNQAVNFGLENISTFCERLGNPQLDYPIIHVAGTNGKGTTCHILDHIYSQAGYKTGLFTSPHLLKYNERFRISGREVSDHLILKFFQEAEGFLGEVQLTYFEISTALAFWLFTKENVEIAIIETGLGGRLDSTNIVDPEVSIITSVGLDHQDVLGDSIEEIAREKAGIIKPGKPVILANVSEQASQEIYSIAQSSQSKVYDLRDRNPLWDNGSVILSDPEEIFDTHFIESVNKWNVSAAITAVDVIKDIIDVPKQVVKKSVMLFNGVPGRFEKLRSNALWYFSGSHNNQALDSTLETVKGFGDKNPAIIFSILKDKLNNEILGLLKSIKRRYYFEPEGDRVASYEEVNRVLSVKKINNTSQKEILKELDTSLVIFTGSFYFYTTVKQWMEEIKQPH